MTHDFTLREVACPTPEGVQERCDLVFRGGRLAHWIPLETRGPARLHLRPGFIDAHLHLLQLGLGRQRLDLSETTSLAEALERTRAYAAEHPERSVLWAQGWDQTTWTERRIPERAELDRIVSDRPLILRRVCGHLAVLNGRALADAGRQWSGLEEHGVLTEEQAMGLATLWPSTPEEREQALRDGQEAALGAGIVAIAEMGSHGAIDTYLGLVKRDALRLRVDLHVKPSQIELALRLRREGWLDRGGLRLGGVKAFLDGSLGARTAALQAPYADRPGQGIMLMTDEALAELLRRCRRARLPLALHAIGDAAIEQALRVAEREAAEAGALAPGELWIEHAELLGETQCARLARLRIGIGAQPNFIARWGVPGGLYEQALGAERWQRLNPLRAVLDAGIALRFGSDGMPMDPALGLKGALAHPVEAWRLTPEEAWEVYSGNLHPRGPTTRWEACWQPGCDHFVLYTEDPARLAEGSLTAAPVCGVFVGGAWLREPPQEVLRLGIVHADA